MTEDLFQAPKTQSERVYEFIKSHGRIPTHALNQFGVQACINSVQSRARELKARGKIWRVKEAVRICLDPKGKEEWWSIYEADRS